MAKFHHVNYHTTEESEAMLEYSN